MRKKRYPAIAIAHSKTFKSSAIFPLTASRDDKGNVIKYHSDLYLLLREKNLEKKIGTETLRAYVDSLRTQVTPHPELTDDELFKLIEPKEVNTITDAYQYAKYLREHADDVKSRYDGLVTAHKRYVESTKK